MSDSSRESLGGEPVDGEPVNGEGFITSWARISLDYGHVGYELAEDDEPQDSDAPADRLRAEIEEVIGAIRQAAARNQRADSAELDPVLARLEKMDLTDQLLEEMLAVELDGAGIPDAEQLGEADELAGAPASQESKTSDDLLVVDLSIPPRADEAAEGDQSEASEEAEDADEDAELDAELERRIQEASSQDVVNALVLASVDLPELMVYESDDDHVDVYVLCLETEEGPVTAHVTEQGRLEPGSPFEEFAADLMGELPTRGGICADENSYSLSAPVTVLGEELTLDADSRVAALLEVEFADLPKVVSAAQVSGMVEAAPADKGWSLLSADPVSMLNLLQKAAKPAVVAESNGYNHHLSFIVPGGSQTAAYEKGSWGEWMNRVVGDPDPNDADSGSVIDLAWGAPKVLSRYLPQDSFALDMVWALPGNLPDPLNFLRLNDGVENLTWVYGLDDSEARRLRNYVEDSASELGMESVLQLLGLPDELAKIALGSFDISAMEGFSTLAPKAGLNQEEVVAAEPLLSGAGDRVSKVSHKLMKRPWIFAADGAVQLSASGLLALLALRRRARGESAGAAAAGSAALLGTGLSELALARSFQKLKRLQALQEQTGQVAPKPELSLMDELAAASESGDEHDARSDSLDRAKQHVSDLVRKLGKRFRTKHSDE